MKRVALAVLALAVIVAMPASAQTGVPVENALVVISSKDDTVMQSILAGGGSPSGVQKALKAAEDLLLALPPRVSTDAGGHFTLDASLDAGVYAVTVFEPGFVASSDSMIIDGSGAAKNLTIFMQPSAMLSGRVTDSQGKPIPGVVVAASSPHSANYDITMDDGVFVLDTGLKSGIHDIYAFKPGIDVDRLQSLINNAELGMLGNKVPALFKTGERGYVSQTLKVQLEQSKLTTLNVQLENSNVVSGRVTDGIGHPVQDIAVFAFDDSGVMVDTAATTDYDGRYTLNNDLASGTYTIVIPPLFSKGYAPASANVNVQAENVADLSLAKSNTIRGRVIDAGGNPVAGATVFAAPKNLGTIDTQLSKFLAAGMAATTTEQDGRFVLDSGIATGTHVVTASFGSMPVSNSVEVQASSPVNITLDFAETITIKGRVTDAGSKPIENALVAPSFVSAISGAELFAIKTSNDGTYELTVPLKNNSTKSLFDKVTISAAGYKSATAQGNETTALDRTPTTKITGVVIAQKPLLPSVETVLTRKGTVNFEHAGAQYGVGLQTNARVLAAAFDPTNKNIILNLEGVQDATGRSEFSIPKELMSGPFAVTLDSKPTESVITTENQTHSMISVEHKHDLQQIVIQGATAVPELPLPAALAAAGLAATLAWKRLRR